MRLAIAHGLVLALCTGLIAADILPQESSEEFRRAAVIPRAAHFKPGKAARSIQLKLSLEKQQIRQGQRFRYRLEIKNTGREAIFFYENPSFLRTGTLSSDLFKFYVTSPTGEKQRLREDISRSNRDFGNTIYHPDGWDKLSAEQKKAHIEARNRDAANEFAFELRLEPGETLITLPWKSTGEFRELRADYAFRPGQYKITALYDDAPSPAPDDQTVQEMLRRGLSREEIARGRQKDKRRALGQVRSNTVIIKVLP